jgi:hypothetical protein
MQASFQALFLLGLALHPSPSLWRPDGYSVGEITGKLPIGCPAGLGHPSLTEPCAGWFWGYARIYLARIVSTPSLAPFPHLSSRPRLLHVDVNPTHFSDDQKEHEPHQDERQIRLDTDRSFVLYPVGDVLSEPTPLHFHPRRICRPWAGRCSTRPSGRAQQAYRTSFSTTSRFELLSSQSLDTRFALFVKPDICI